MIIPINEFFAEMELSETEKKRREDLANELLILFLMFFAEIEAEKTIQNKTKPDVNTEYFKNMLYRQYCDDVETFIVLVAALLGRRKISDEMSENIRQRVSYIVDTTLKFDDDFYTSKDRAIMLACNEANYVGNDTDYNIAKYQGYRHKKWLTMKDEKVRFTHSLADGQTVGIDDYFNIGGYEMLYPMDTSQGAPPSECVNCRCVIQYLR